MVGTTDAQGTQGTQGAEPAVEEGHSLWSDAWRRLKRNRIALASGVYIVVIAIFGFTAPLLSEHVTGFQLAETHTELSNSGPGTQDVSQTFPTFDGDASEAAFAAVDLDGDGALICTREVLGSVTGAGAAGSEAAGQEVTRLACPELDLLNRLVRHFDFLFVNYDKAYGAAEPGDGPERPDGWITWHEFPQTDEALSKRFRGYGLSGPDAFRALDVDGDKVIAKWEVTARARVMRWNDITKDVLLAEYDTNGDLTITRDEYPGAPALRTFHMGIDGGGRDVFTRLAYGARISITIGLLATFVSLFIGVSYGAIAGFMGGRVDNLMMRFVDILYGLPYFFIVIVLMSIVERSTINLFIALGAVQWLSMARVVRGQVISLKTREFVEAARAIGVSRFAIIFRHLVRNAIGPVIIYGTLMVPGVILQEAFLSFLGLGVQPPDPSWGNMITEGKDVLEHAPHLILFPGIALATTLFAMNFFGDGVRDAIDPKMQKG